MNFEAAEPSIFVRLTSSGGRLVIKAGKIKYEPPRPGKNPFAEYLTTNTYIVKQYKITVGLSPKKSLDVLADKPYAPKAQSEKQYHLAA